MLNNKTILKFLNSKTSEEENKKMIEQLDQNPNLIIDFLKIKKVWEEQERIHTDSSYLQTDFQKIVSKLLNSKKSKPNFAEYFKHNFYKIASIFLLLISIGTVSINLFKTESEEVFHQIIVKKGESSELVLADGTKVKVGPDSKLSIGNYYGEKTRSICIDGEAYFEVTHNKKCPFEVVSNDMKITVLGTKFIVKSYKEDNTVSTKLIEGSVKVDLLSSKNKNSFTLTPNTKLDYNKSNGSVSINKLKPEYDLSWMKNTLAFKDEKFETIINQINRVHNVNIVLDYPEIAEEKFSGVFDKESVDDILETFSLISDFKIEKTKLTILIKPKDKMPMK